LANSLTVAKNGASFSPQDTQRAVLAASRGDKGLPEITEVVEAARRLATLTGQSLTDAVGALQLTGITQGSPDRAIASALSLAEDRVVSTGDLAFRERNLKGSALVGSITQGMAKQAQVGMAEQGNIYSAQESLTRQFIETVNPAMIMHADALRENSTKLEALNRGLKDMSFSQKSLDWLLTVFGSTSTMRATRDATNREIGYLGEFNNSNGPLPVIGK
jgi:hypothetical protein